MSTDITDSIKILTDRVHELLNGPNGEYLQGEGQRETLRLVIEVPKAFLLQAAWLEMTQRARRGGAHEIARFHERGGDEQWSVLRKWARPQLERIIENEMHMELHKLALVITLSFMRPRESRRRNRRMMVYRFRGQEYSTVGRASAV